MNINTCLHGSFFLRISKNVPTTKDVEPLLEIDGDIRSFEVFLSSRTPVLTVRDVEMFLPCTVNLDPKLREIIAGQPRPSHIASRSLAATLPPTTYQPPSIQLCVPTDMTYTCGHKKQLMQSLHVVNHCNCPTVKTLLAYSIALHSRLFDRHCPVTVKTIYPCI